MINKLSFLLFFILILSGCSHVIGRDEFKGNIQIIEQALNENDWEKAKNNGDRLLKSYSSNKWKLQMIGDEGEYEDLYESINRLCAAIEEKNPTQTKMELASIQSILKEIYSL